jgi:LPPG:FO 2-phospho-L-lactate transferase
MSEGSRPGRVIALCGGVGGAKLAMGLYRILGEKLTIVVNTGDDFEHLGLCVSPDIDTVLYTLSGLANRELGWGRGDETWNFMEAVAVLGAETWFRLGDRDLALHVERTRRLKAGHSLSEIVRDFAKSLGVTAEIVPMSDDPVRTMVVTSEGTLPFQRYFVERRCVPKVERIFFEGAELARPNPALREALADPKLAAIILCPSNPFLSIDPLLSIPGLATLLRQAAVPLVAVSPIIGGKAVKGPTSKIMSELGLAANTQAIADHYAGLLDGLVVDETDRAESVSLALPVRVTATLMTSDADRERLARDVLDFASHLAGRRA